MDGLEKIGNALYGREPTVREYIGGSDARLLHDAAEQIEWLKKQYKSCSDLLCRIGKHPELNIPPELFHEMDALFMGRLHGRMPVKQFIPPRSALFSDDT